MLNVDFVYKETKTLKISSFSHVTVQAPPKQYIRNVYQDGYLEQLYLFLKTCAFIELSSVITTVKFVKNASALTYGLE